MKFENEEINQKIKQVFNRHEQINKENEDFVERIKSDFKLNESEVGHINNKTLGRNTVESLNNVFLNKKRNNKKN